MLAFDEIIQHAALERHGTVERVERRQILDARGLVAAQNIAHAGRLKLEDAAGKAARKYFVRFGIVERQVLKTQFHAVALLDQLDRVVDERQRGKAQKIHLKQRQFFQGVHVVLRDNFVFVGL